MKNITKIEDLIRLSVVRYTIIALQVAIILLASIGNFLVIIILLKGGKLKSNVTAYLVLNLAVCEFLNSSIYQPLRLTDLILPFESEFRLSKEHRNIFCRISGYCSTIFACCAFHTITAISVERFLLIRFPLKAKRWLSTKKTIKILVMIWLFSLLAALPLPLYFTYTEELIIDGIILNFCNHIINGNRITSGGRGYFISLFIFYYALPLLLITVNYSLIFATLYKRIETDSDDPAVRRTTNSRRIIAKFMLSLAVLFAICNGPFFCTFLYICLGGQVTSNPILALSLIDILGSLYAVFNPIIYAASRSVLTTPVSGTDQESVRLVRRSTS